MSDPLVFLDVDGTLLPFGRPATGDDHVRWFGEFQWMNLGLGRALGRLPCQLVWATSWEHSANTEIAPILGLPELPVVEWPELPPPVPYGVHWKTPTLIEWAEGLPFAWIDDELTGTDEDWVAGEHLGEALLLEVDPQRGLMPGDIAELTEWLHEVAT